mmetsp:Transcript_14002/g.33103  ORF Transcript_14002/g.33103 Transcript_14002/m.33103 type:complete len:185 (+) Transcript_14002:294-848(+)
MIVASSAVGIVAFLFVTMGSFGVLAFAQTPRRHFPGDILTALPHNAESSAARGALAVALALMCPLLVWPMRLAADKIFVTLFLPTANPVTVEARALTRHVIATSVLLTSATVLSLALRSITDVFSVLGATCGCFFFFIYPSACFLKESQGDMPSTAVSRALAWLVLLFGVTGSAVCTWGIATGL